MNGTFRPATLLVIIIGFLPLFITGFQEHSQTSDLLSLSGRSAGVFGLSLLLVATFISVRIPGFDTCFGGLTHVWKIHHVLGALSFVLLMAHPLLLAFAAARSSISAAGTILVPPPSAWSAWTGWASFLALAIFLAPTFWFFGQPQYQKWKGLHALSGLAVLFALGHALAATRDSPRAVWIVYGTLALIAFVYRKFIAPHTARWEYTITRVETVNRGVVELTLRPQEKILAYRPGQFIYLTPLDPVLAAGHNEEHPYTLSSAPGDQTLRVAIKDVGDATHALQNVARGTRMLVEGPYGDFFPLREIDAPALWLAGGIGIAPFLSRARSLPHVKSPDIHLIYCAQDASRAHFLEELETIAASAPGFKMTRHFFAREGVLTAAFVAAACPDFAKRIIYVCGPPAFVVASRTDLRATGIPAARIHTEDFTWL